jgi:hypothetical protein
VRGLSLERSLGINGTRLSAVLGEDVVGRLRLARAGGRNGLSRGGGLPRAHAHAARLGAPAAAPDLRLIGVGGYPAAAAAALGSPPGRTAGSRPLSCAQRLASVRFATSSFR